MPKKRRRQQRGRKFKRVVKQKRINHYARHLIQETMIAIFVILALLFVFIFMEKSPLDSAAAAGGQTTISSPALSAEQELSDAIRLCSRGSPSACADVAGLAEQKQASERERLRKERIVS